MAGTAGWIDLLPGLASVDAATRAELARAAPLRVAAGAAVFSPGAACEAYLLVLSGTVRVQMASESGREIVLYRVAAGEACLLTTACLLAGRPYAAEGVAETAVEAAAIPAERFDRLIASSAPFRRFVFAAYGTRLTDMMMLVEEVAFRRLDARLAGLLLARAAPGGRLDTTHQALAAELGSAREAVSRLLKEFERSGLVALQRGRIALADPDRLRALADAAG
jgi:CRP/FNR family transcriptional regulator